MTVEKKLMINIYEKHDLEPDPKVDTDLYWALVKHVIPHDDCRNHFLDWNAWILQNKGKKIRHGIIFQSDEFQLGKGSLYDVMRDILGRNNAKKIELQQALDKGKGYLINSMMVLIDEASDLLNPASIDGFSHIGADFNNKVQFADSEMRLITENDFEINVNNLSPFGLNGFSYVSTSLPMMSIGRFGGLDISNNGSVSNVQSKGNVNVGGDVFAGNYKGDATGLTGLSPSNLSKVSATFTCVTRTAGPSFPFNTCQSDEVCFSKLRNIGINGGEQIACNNSLSGTVSECCRINVVLNP